ncbi:MAG TPA: alpha/beta fold hydrolase [Holophagaceae bacterium]
MAGPPPWVAGLLKVLAWGFGAYAALCLAAFLLQRRMMYFPERMPEAEAIRAAARMGLAPWRDREGRLLGWRRPVADPARPRMLVVHGNAGDALGRVAYLPVLEAAGFEGVLLEYPGYGPREGHPAESVLVADGRAALRQLKAEDSGPVLLLGESLGSGVAVQVAATDPDAAAGLLLVTPFARMTEVASHHYPLFPMRLLLRDRWDSLGAIRRYSGPVAMLLAGRDEVVGAAQGRRLAAAVPGPLLVREVPWADHNGLPLGQGQPPWPELLGFLRRPGGMGQ